MIVVLGDRRIANVYIALEHMVKLARTFSAIMKGTMVSIIADEGRSEG